MITDSTGNVCFDADYYPYGRENDFVNSCPQNFKFTGKERDPETGLDNFGARYYASSYARFMSPDPGHAGAVLDNPQSWDAYSYVMDNPETLTDPTGACPGLNGKGQCNEESLVALAWAMAHPVLASSTAHQQNANATLLGKLVFGESSRIGNTADQRKEVAAVAYSAVNRAKYLKAHPKVRLNFFGANGRTLQGVIVRGQYASVGGRLWNAAASPGTLNRFEAPVWSLSLTVAKGVLAGTIPDPFASQGGTYGFRTTGSGPPGGSFKVFNDQIPGSGNTFYGLSQ